MTISELLIPAAQQVFIYGQKLLEGIPAEKFARKPFQDGKITMLNHAAFQYGHLCLYPERIAGLLNLPKDNLKTPADFAEVFKKGVVCHDDPEGKIYPAMSRVADYFLESHETILKLLADVSDSDYQRINIEEASKDRFPTVGSFVIFLLTAHMNTHFGQVLGWRRCQGLPGA